MDIQILTKLLNMVDDSYICYTNLDGKVLYYNKKYEEKFFVNQSDDICEDLDLLYTTYRFSRHTELEDIRDNREVIYKHAEINNNRQITYNVHKKPYRNKDGKIEGILCVIKELASEDELNRLRENFFANLKHEFRTPLNMVFSTLQLLERKCINCSKGTCRDCFINNIKHISTNSLRILKLSNNFIDLSRIQSSCMDMNFRNYDIVKFIEDICDAINSYKKFNNISLIFDTDMEELIISFDQEKIERVVLNLISNAIKFNIENGSILVKITNDDDYVRISVEDSGVGIDSKYIDNLFKSFSLIDDRLTKMAEGSGVGLSLCKHLIEMHDGFIEVKSELGKGSKFTINIPNILNSHEDIDDTYERIDTYSFEKIKMELSDIYT